MKRTNHTVKTKAQRTKKRNLGPLSHLKAAAGPANGNPPSLRTTPVSGSSFGAASSSGLTVRVYAGDGSAMIAFSLDASLTNNLAGFAIQRTSPSGESKYLPNRLNFASGITTATTPQQRKFTGSDKAPYQKFRWFDVPSAPEKGEYTYTVTAKYFNGNTLRDGASASATAVLVEEAFSNFDFGFTRGYLSSQAYVDHFNNAPIRPTPKTLDYNTKKYEAQYEWLGFHARKLIFDFINECLSDRSITVDLFAYDLDEPDFIQDLEKLGSRLRAYLDNAPLHTKPGALEITAHARLVKSAGKDNVKQGHFKRFSHSKVLIMKKSGKAVKVLTGSANFSVRGLYVQANNVLVFDDEDTAGLYEEAFDQAFTDPSQFASSAIAEGWNELSMPGEPKFSVAFSPHTTANVSLDEVAAAIRNAKSSVLFAVMELSGGGDVMKELLALPGRNIFSYGMTQTMSGIKIYKPGSSNGIIVPFSYLKQMVPPPFQAEYSGGMGQVIHHKFVVVDFNTANPVVFTGSSNLSAGGEVSNGDNLLAIYNPVVATAYAIEAARLVDHYHFRAAIQGSKQQTGLSLQGPNAQQDWWQPYYDPNDIRNQDRRIFAGV